MERRKAIPGSVTYCSLRLKIDWFTSEKEEYKLIER